MRLIKYLSFLNLVCLKYYSAESQTVNTTTNVLNINDILKKISLGGEEFSLELFQKVSAALAPVGYDFMISPFSIWSLLVLIAEGAKGNTLQQLHKTLRIDQDILSVREGYKLIQKALNVNTSTIQVSSIQAVFSDKNLPVDPEYENVIERIYRATLFPIDFHKPIDATNTINSYVKSITRGLIGEVVNVSDLKGAQMLLLSGIFFKGQWKIPFNETFTKQEHFFDEDDKVLGTVNMMFNKGPFAYAAISEIDSHVLELPYGVENRLSMVIFLPRKGAPLTSVIQNIAKFGITKVYSRLRKVNEDFEDAEVEVYLPRFSATTDLVLNVVLEEMGIIDAFDQAAADFSKISSRSMYLSTVFHKTKIEVNEEGTVAAAVSGGILANKATPPRFLVNRPFAYIIIEKTTNLLIFCGVVKDPTKSGI